MSETTERYETETKALVTELNNLNREIHNPESTIGRIYGLLKTFSYELAEKVIPEALKACELNYSNPEVGNLCKLLTRLRDMMQSPEQLAGIGIDYLEEAVLDVLFQARETSPENPYVQRFDIRRKIGVYNLYDKYGWSIGGFLNKLKGEKRIEKEKRGKASFWKLTEAEYQKRVG